ncbi:MAG: cobaltochelatase subunit CobT [Proteobacteria bacterium]|nr:MAG: cobaltochelatase subunit CobT [Pseudomonadota bacterium]
MEKNKQIITSQRRIATSTARALSQHQDFNPDLDADPPLEGILPVPTDPIGLTQLRAATDSLAMRQRHHDTRVHSRWLPATAPANKLFSIAEQIRCETWGSRHLLGVKANLAAAHGAQYQKRKAIALEPQSLEQVVGLIIRNRLIGIDLPEPLRTQLLDHQDALWPKIGRYMVDLEGCVDDQDRFGRCLLGMIKTLGLQSGTCRQENPSSDQQEACESPGTNYAVTAENPEDRRKNARGKHQHDLPDIDPSSEHHERSEKHAERYLQHKRPLRKSPSADLQNKDGDGYRVYTRNFDTEVTAVSLCSTEMLAKLRKRLDKQYPPIRRHLSRLSRLLQLRFRSQAYSNWDFDQEEGELDPNRLSRVLIAPQSPLSFKTISREGDCEILVTILIDNSGSMRGKPITVAALSADMLAATLEQCGIKVEILGFTTRKWNGGASRQQWVDDGCPSNPGRLGELLHIIYKSADTPWRRSKNGMGLTQKTSLLKENIDGEALLWAYQRMRCRSEPRQILMVIADGAPQDDATLTANGFSYLDRHLRRVIDFIETRTPIELVAIGIGHDITDYYEQAIRLNHIGELGLEMTKSLYRLFSQNTKRKNGRSNLR